jgi:hypothetical protein
MHTTSTRETAEACLLFKEESWMTVFFRDSKAKKHLLIKRHMRNRPNLKKGHKRYNYNTG